MLTTMYAALVTCAISAEPDEGFFYATCTGRKDLAQAVAEEQADRQSYGTACVAYTDEETESTISFVLRCE